MIVEHKKVWQDCKHILWLLKQTVTSFIKGDLYEAREAMFWMKIHWNYKSRKIG